MIRLRFIIVCLILQTAVWNSANAQWEMDFQLNDLSEWSGDINRFIINADNQLQLNDTEAGETFIFRPSTISEDTISIGFYHLLDFAPSDNNKSTIYLTLDNEDLSVASGYFIEIGENGSEDAIKFYYLENGSEELMASATMAAMAAEPAVVRVQIDIYPDGLWSLNTNYEGEEFISLDIEFMEDRFSFADGAYFGIGCKYSASRADKFFYDDMYVRKFERDVEPPIIISAQTVGPKSILIDFNEPVSLSDATTITNYTADNDLGNPINIISLGILSKSFLLEYDSEFDPSIDYELIVTGISDQNGNVMGVYRYNFNFPVPPEAGELLVSEILFDPYTSGEDFIELYNPSDKYLQLKFLSLRNDQRDETKTITDLITINPKSYLALTEETSFLIQEYKPIADANIAVTEIPAFNNDEGNIMLINPDGIVLDSFDYNEDQHFELLDDTEGVSLERVSFDVESTNNRNWQSASQNARYATPGYANSSSINIEPGNERFSLITETFSPNQDGNDDLMILSYNLDKSGFVGNISVHDAAGFKIKDLSRNELLSTQGIITWDGANEEGNISDLGIYILVGSLFHTDGEVMNFKKTTVLADFID